MSLSASQGSVRPPVSMDTPSSTGVKGRWRGSLRATLTLLFVVCLWVVPIVLISTNSSPGASEREALLGDAGDARWGQVGSREVTGEQAASVTLTISEPEPVRLGNLATSGTVTQVLVHPGDVVRDGGGVVAIDGQHILAYVAAEPFYRVLAVGSGGGDVAALDTWLVKNGWAEHSTLDSQGRYSRETERVVRDVGAFFGWPRVAGFNPGLTIFVPSERVEVTEVLVKVGDSSGPGATVFDAGRKPAGGTVELLGSPSDRAILGLADDYVLTVESREVVITGLELDEVASVAVAEAGGWVGGADGSSTILIDGLRIRLQQSLLWGTVPGEAIVEDRDRLCVMTGAPDALTAALIQSAVAGIGEPGLVLVDEALIGQRLLLNPRVDQQCA